MRRILVVGIAALALSACGSSGGADNTTTPQPSSTSASPTTATVSQWASVVAAERDSQLEDLNKFSDDCLLAPVAGLGEATCGIQAITVGAIGETARLTMSNARSSLGEPPSEIAALVSQHEAAGASLSQASDVLPDTCPEEKCMDEWAALVEAVDEMTSALNAWQPYL